MLGASTLLIANLMPQENHQWGGCLSYSGAFFVVGYGWPCPHRVTFSEDRYNATRVDRWPWENLMINAVVSVLILSAFAAGMEAIIKKISTTTQRKQSSTRNIRT